MGNNMQEAFIGFDLGTTVCKCLIFDQELNLLAMDSNSLGLRKSKSGYVEQDPEEWWNAVVATCRNSLQKIEEAEGQIHVTGISVSSQGISIVPVDKSMNNIGNSLSWLDRRATAEAQLLEERFGKKELFKRTGKRIDAAYSYPKILWLKGHYPDGFSRIAKIIMPLDYIMFRLSGELATDHSMAAGSLCYNIHDLRWDEEILDSFAVPKSLFSPIVFGGTKLGTLTTEAAEAIGINKDAELFVGGQDQKIAAFGAGADRETTTLSLGTAMAIIQLSDRPIIDKEMRLPCFAYVQPDKWVLEGVGGGCSVLEWFRETILGMMDYDRMNDLAAAEPERPTFIHLFPYFTGMGSPFKENAMDGGVHGMNLHTTQGEIIKGLYEGIAFQIKENIDVMEELSGQVSELRAFGGGTNSDIWCRIIADITGKPVGVLQNGEVAGLGAAAIALQGKNKGFNANAIYGDLGIRTQFTPKKEVSALYEEKYQAHLELRNRLLQ
jgi:xylulokinase